MMQPYGNIASCGHGRRPRRCTTTVMPFIIRGVSLLGIASAGTARRHARKRLADTCADAWKPAHLDAICTREVGLDGLAGVFPGHARRRLLRTHARQYCDCQPCASARAGGHTITPTPWRAPWHAS